MNDNNINSGLDIIVEAFVGSGTCIMNEPIIASQISYPVTSSLPSSSDEILSTSTESACAFKNYDDTCVNDDFDLRADSAYDLWITLRKMVRRDMLTLLLHHSK